MKISNLIEALKPSQYRPYVKNWDRSRYVDIFTHTHHRTDKKKFRLYIPLEPEKSNVKPIPEVESAVKSAGYEIIDYVAGIAAKTDDSKRMIKIGKILKDQELLQKFANDPQRAAKKPEHMVVISRHPYDVAGMSTDRGWKSCMNLKDGSNRRYVALDVKEGSLVAYVIKLDDLNINHPVGRILIKPFVNLEDNNQVALGAETKVYGTDVNGFKKIVTEWCDEVNATRELQGIFELNKQLYNDGGGKKQRMIGKNFSIEDKIKFNPKEIESIKNPSEELMMIAMEADPMVLQYIKNPSRRVIEYFLEKKGVDYVDYFPQWNITLPSDMIHAYLKKNPKYIMLVPNPTLEQCQDAFNKMGASVIYYLKKTKVPEKFWLWALKQYPDTLMYLDQDQTEELHEYFIDHNIKVDPSTWGRAWHLKRPSKKILDKLVQVAGHGVLGSLSYHDNNVKITKKEGDLAVNAHPNAMSKIPTKWVSKSVQLEAVKKEPRMINFAAKEVKLKAVEEVPSVVQYIPTGNQMTGKMSAIANQMCKIALSKDPSVLRFIEMPTEDMVMTGVNDDPLLMFTVKTKYWPIDAMALVIHKYPQKKKEIEAALKKSRMYTKKWVGVESALERLQKSPS